MKRRSGWAVMARLVVLVRPMVGYMLLAIAMGLAGCNPQAGQDAGRTAAPKRPASLPRSRSRSPHSPLPRAGEAAPAVSEASADMAAPAYSPAGMQAGTVPGAEAAGRDSAVTAGRDLPVVYTSSRRWLCSCSLDSYHHSSKRLVFSRLHLGCILPTANAPGQRSFLR